MMRYIIPLLAFFTSINGMQPIIYSPRPYRYPRPLASRDIIFRPDTPAPHRVPTPPPLEYAVTMSPEEVHVEEVRARAIEVTALSKKKVACLVAVTAITSAVLTAAVTLTINFTSCNK